MWTELARTEHFVPHVLSQNTRTRIAGACAWCMVLVMVLVTRTWRGTRSPPQRSLPLPVGGRIARPKYEGCGRQRQLGPSEVCSQNPSQCRCSDVSLRRRHEARTLTRAAISSSCNLASHHRSGDQPTFIRESTLQFNNLKRASESESLRSLNSWPARPVTVAGTRFVNQFHYSLQAEKADIRPEAAVGPLVAVTVLSLSGWKLEFKSLKSRF